MSASARILQISAEHIAQGVRRDAMACPIARACMSEFEPYSVFITTRRLSIETAPGVWESYFVPSEAREFIQAFDSGASVQPFSFTTYRID